MLYQVSVLHSFLWLNSTLWIDHVLFLHSSADGHLGSFHCLFFILNNIYLFDLVVAHGVFCLPWGMWDL